MKVLNFAQAIDESARLFYEEMAARVDNAGVRTIFHKLAEEEVELMNHHRVLAIQGDIPDTEILDQATNLFEQLRQQEKYLRVDDDVSAYRLALDAERDLTKMYWRAVNAETNPEVRELIVRIAQNEQSTWRKWKPSMNSPMPPIITWPGGSSAILASSITSGAT